MMTKKIKAVGWNPAAFKGACARNYIKVHASRKGQFQREKLPNPLTYYQKHLKAVSQGDGKGWTSALCPFHGDHHPSLAINLKHGGFRCHACGVSGGDVLAFHRMLHGLGFVEAAIALGAWKGATR